MTINDVHAPKEKVRLALKCILEGDSYKDAARQVGVTKRTLVNWAKAGLLTDGKHWTEARKEEDTIRAFDEEGEKLEVRVEKKREWEQDVSENLRDAIAKTSEKLADGEVALDAQDIETLEKVERRIGQRAEEVQALLNQYARKWFKAMRETLDHATFEELVAEKKRIEREALEEINPEGAKQLVDKTNPDFEDYDES